MAHTLKPLLKEVKSLELRIEEEGGLGRPVVQKELAEAIQDIAGLIQNPQLRMDMINKAKEVIADLENVARR
jgi:hypothetical protein